jgi:hypothetical protein
MGKRRKFGKFIPACWVSTSDIVAQLKTEKETESQKNYLISKKCKFVSS